MATRDRIFPGSLVEVLQANALALIIITSLVFYCWFNYWMGELRVDYFIFSIGVLAVYYFHPQTRIYFLLALPIFLKLMIYDSLRYVPFEWLTPIRVEEPYVLDKMLFGIEVNGTVVLFHEYFLRFAHPILDVVVSGFYLLHEPMMFIYLFLFWKLKSVGYAGRFSVAFVLMNLISFATYMLYPAAAPWYVEQYGFAQPLGPVFGDAAGMGNMDALLGVSYTTNLYARLPVVFGAIPSMHIGFVIMGWFYSLRVNRKLAWVAGIYTFIIGFGALYLQHHYLIDLVIGVLYALLAYFIVEKGFRNQVERAYQSLFYFAGRYGGWTLLGSPHRVIRAAGQATQSS